MEPDNHMPAEVLVMSPQVMSPQKEDSRDLNNGHIVAIMCLVLVAMLALWVAGIALPRAH
jgi:hypothetical protein